MLENLLVLLEIPRREVLLAKPQLAKFLEDLLDALSHRLLHLLVGSLFFEIPLHEGPDGLERLPTTLAALE